MCKPFLLVAEPQHLTGPQTRALIPVGGEPGSQEAELERQQTASVWLSLLGGGEMDARPCAGVRGGWDCPGRSWHQLLTPAGLAPLSHSNKSSLGAQDHRMVGLEETSLQHPWDAVPHAGRDGIHLLLQEQRAGKVLGQT